MGFRNLQEKLEKVNILAFTKSLYNINSQAMNHLIYKTKGPSMSDNPYFILILSKFYLGELIVKKLFLLKPTYYSSRISKKRKRKSFVKPFFYVY